MAKVSLTNPASFVNDASAAAQVAANNAALIAAIENTLSRDGTAPNQMSAPLDMNSQPIINLPRATSPTEPVRLQEVGDTPGYAIAAQAAKAAADADVVLTHADVVLTHADVVTTHADVVSANNSAASAAATLAGALQKANNLSDLNSVATAKVNLSLVKADVGLGNVDNTSDVNKPVSTAQAAADALKANIASPTFTGTPAAPTPTANDNSPKLATTAYVDTGLALKQAVDVQLFSNIPQNSKSIAYTTVLTDGEKHILHPSADTTARTWTIDSNANVAYPIGTAITFINQNGAGVITIAITADTMRLAGAGTIGSRTLAANGVATAIKITATEWIISGAGLT